MRWQSNLWTLYLIYFLIGALGFAPLFAPMVAIAGLWFERRKGFAIGIVTAGGAIGQGVVPYITRLLITEVGWRDAALYVGVGYCQPAQGWVGGLAGLMLALKRGGCCEPHNVLST